MPTLKYKDLTYNVNHAVKGPDYIHGYNANGDCVVAFDGVANFSGFEYDGVYLDPAECFTESCNGVKHVGGRLLRMDGTPVDRGTFGAYAFAPGKGALASGFRIPCSGAKCSDNVNGETVPDNEEDWRYNEAVGDGSMVSGEGAIAYSRASKSLGYRTQTGYPNNTAAVEKRPEAIVYDGKIPFDVGPDEDYNDIIAAKEWLFDEDSSGIKTDSRSWRITQSGTFSFKATNESDSKTTVVVTDDSGNTLAETSYEAISDNVLEFYVPPKVKKFTITASCNGGYVQLCLRIEKYFPGDNVGQGAFAIGADTAALGKHSFAGGYRTAVYANHAFGFGSGVIVKGLYAAAFGLDCEASGEAAFAAGYLTIASGEHSFATGRGSQATGQRAYAEGLNTKATGVNSHAEGNSTLASGNTSHAEGGNNEARGKWSHVEGRYNVAVADASHVQGKFSVEDTEGKYAHIVGGGTSDTKRKNIHTIDWSGNAWFAGGVSFDKDLNVGGKVILSSAAYGDKLPTNPVEGQLFFLKV